MSLISRRHLPFVAMRPPTPETLSHFFLLSRLFLRQIFLFSHSVNGFLCKQRECTKVPNEILFILHYFKYNYYCLFYIIDTFKLYISYLCLYWINQSLNIYCVSVVIWKAGVQVFTASMYYGTFFCPYFTALHYLTAVHFLLLLPDIFDANPKR